MCGIYSLRGGRDFYPDLTLFRPSGDAALSAVIARVSWVQTRGTRAPTDASRLPRIERDYPIKNYFVRLLAILDA